MFVPVLVRIPCRLISVVLMSRLDGTIGNWFGAVPVWYHIIPVLFDGFSPSRVAGHSVRKLREGPPTRMYVFIAECVYDTDWHERVSFKYGSSRPVLSRMTIRFMLCDGTVVGKESFDFS